MRERGNGLREIAFEYPEAFFAGQPLGNSQVGLTDRLAYSVRGSLLAQTGLINNDQKQLDGVQGVGLRAEVLDAAANRFAHRRVWVVVARQEGMVSLQHELVDPEGAGKDTHRGFEPA